MHYHDPVYIEARKKLTEAVEEYAQAVENDPIIVMGATVVYETTKFDEDGDQEYALQYVILDPGSLVHSVGLLSAARDRLSEYINRRSDD